MGITMDSGRGITMDRGRGITMDRGTLHGPLLCLWLMIFTCFSLMSINAMEVDPQADFNASEFKDDVASNRIFNTPNSDPYKILGVEEGADPKNAYKKLAFKYHPDKLVGKNVETQRTGNLLFTKIGAAHTLINSASVKNINKLDEDGCTDLHRALRAKDGVAALFLLSKGADPNLKFNLVIDDKVKINDCTALYLTILTIDSAIDVIKKLLECGANPWDIVTTCEREDDTMPFKNTYSESVFDFARKIPKDSPDFKNFEVLMQYEEDKIRDAIKSGKADQTHIDAALRIGSNELVDALIRDAIKSGNTRPADICLAAKIGSKELVEALLRAGANVNVLDNSNYTSLLYAVINKDEKMVDLLLRFKANPNTDMPYDTNTGYKIIHFALEEGLVEIAKNLLMFGANPNAWYVHKARKNVYIYDKDYFFDIKESKSPLFLAIKHNLNFTLIECLINHGANIDSIFKIQCDKDSEYNKSNSLLGYASSDKSYSLLSYASSELQNPLFTQHLNDLLKKHAIKKLLSSMKSFFIRNYKYTTFYGATIKRNLSVYGATIKRNLSKLIKSVTPKRFIQPQQQVETLPPELSTTPIVDEQLPPQSQSSTGAGVD